MKGWKVFEKFPTSSVCIWLTFLVKRDDFYLRGNIWADFLFCGLFAYSSGVNSGRKNLFVRSTFFFLMVDTVLKQLLCLKSTMVKWLGWFGYGDGHRSSRIWEPVMNQWRTRQQKERDGCCLSYAVLNIHWASNRHCTCGNQAVWNLHHFTLSEEVNCSELLKRRPFDDDYCSGMIFVLL